MRDHHLEKGLNFLIWMSGHMGMLTAIFAALEPKTCYTPCRYRSIPMIPMISVRRFCLEGCGLENIGDMKKWSPPPLKLLVSGIFWDVVRVHSCRIRFARAKNVLFHQLVPLDTTYGYRRFCLEGCGLENIGDMKKWSPPPLKLLVSGIFWDVVRVHSCRIRFARAKNVLFHQLVPLDTTYGYRWIPVEKPSRACSAKTAGDREKWFVTHVMLVVSGLFRDVVH